MSLPKLAVVSALALSLSTTPLANAIMCSPQSIKPFTGPGGSSNPFAGSSGLNLFSQAPSQTPQKAVPAPLLSSGPTRSIQFITGPSSPDQTHTRWSIASTDLGFGYSDGTYTYLAFGDSGKCAPNNELWRSNVLVRTTDKDFGDGLTLTEGLTKDGWRAEGETTQFIPSLKKDNLEATTIPTSGVVINGTHYVDYMSVRHWGAPGRWDTNYAATVTSPDGATWTLDPNSVRNNTDHAVTPNDGANANRPGYENIQMTAFLDHEGYVYRLSTPNGRFGSAYLSRAPRDEFPAESAFSYWDGHNWSSDPAVFQHADAAVFGNKVSELSLTYNAYLHKYVAMYLHEVKGLVIRTADSITGPWSQEYLLISQATVPQMYGGFILPNQDDQHIYYVMSTFDDYNVYFMRTDLDFALKHNMNTNNIPAVKQQ